MKIGIFDSGLGGLVIARSIFKKLPGYDYVYLGDTKNVPYGNRSKTEVYNFTRQVVDFLFKNECQLVILACNTASALALRKLQQEYLPKKYPDRRILGVVIPTLEEVIQKYHSHSIGVLATQATARSHIYKKEVQKINQKIRIIEQAAPKLVPMIEKNALQQAESALKLYLEPLLRQSVEAIVLACTHYPILSEVIKKHVGKKVRVVSQTEFLPAKLANYLKRHPEIRKKLTKRGQREFFVTALNRHYGTIAKRLFGRGIKFNMVNY